MWFEQRSLQEPTEVGRSLALVPETCRAAPVPARHWEMGGRSTHSPPGGGGGDSPPQRWGLLMGGLTISDPGPKLGISRWFAREDRVELNGNTSCL